MEFINKNQARELKHSDICSAYEYSMEDKDIDGALIELNGRYPEEGRTVNLKCKMLVYIIEGSGNITVEGKEIELSNGDLILIEPEEKYFWEGDLKLFISSTPAWYPEQNKKVN